MHDCSNPARKFASAIICVMSYEDYQLACRHAQALISNVIGNGCSKEKHEVRNKLSCRIGYISIWYRLNQFAPR